MTPSIETVLHVWTFAATTYMIVYIGTEPPGKIFDTIKQNLYKSFSHILFL